MDLSKAFDCVPHDLLLPKLAAYGIDDNLILYLHTYLLNRKQYVCINNILSEFNKVISGVPQGSIVGHILFNCFFNDFYYFIKNANVHNFADDNTLTTFAQNVKTLISVLESESNIAIDWFETNKMIVNPDKFQSIIADKKKQDHANKTFKVGDKVIKALAKSGKVTMKASRLRSICIEIYKSINSINPFFMNDIFRLRVTNRMVRSQYRVN